MERIPSFLRNLLPNNKKNIREYDTPIEDMRYLSEYAKAWEEYLMQSTKDLFPSTDEQWWYMRAEIEAYHQIQNATQSAQNIPETITYLRDYCHKVEEETNQQIHPSLGRGIEYMSLHHLQDTIDILEMSYPATPISTLFPLPSEIDNNPPQT